MTVQTFEGFLLTRNWRDTQGGIELEYWFATDSGPLCALVRGERSVFFLEQRQLEAARSLLAERDGVLLGYAQWQLGEAPIAARHPIELKRLYADPDSIGAGIGRRLFDAVRADALAQAADLLWLCVYAGNDRARHFYARQGLIEIGRVPYRFVDQVEDDLALGLHFTPASP